MFDFDNGGSITGAWNMNHKAFSYTFICSGPIASCAVMICKASWKNFHLHVDPFVDTWKLQWRRTHLHSGFK